MNGANEVLVQAFLDKRIGFRDIGDMIEEVMNLHQPGEIKSIRDITEADKKAREEAEELIKNKEAMRG